MSNGAPAEEKALKVEGINHMLRDIEKCVQGQTLFQQFLETQNLNARVHSEYDKHIVQRVLPYVVVLSEPPRMSVSALSLLAE